MLFLVLYKFRKRPTKEMKEEFMRISPPIMQKLGIKYISEYFTLGRFDGAAIAEAPDAKAMLKYSMAMADMVTHETLPAIHIDEAMKLIE
jgi:uncharacterized protein with GYD domain